MDCSARRTGMSAPHSFLMTISVLPVIHFKVRSGGHARIVQPQPGFSTFAPASSDCRVSQSGSTSRSSRGPRSASASGGAWPDTKKPEPRRATIAPCATRRSYASTTVDFETCMVPASARIDGSFPPWASDRLAICRRTESMTRSTSVPWEVRSEKSSTVLLVDP